MADRSFMILRNFRNSRASRTDSGFSLITVMTTCLLAATMLAASSAAMLPIFKSIGSEQTNSKLRIACESATDYIVAKLNKSETKDSVDCGMTYGAVKTIAITPGLLGLSPDYVVSAEVKNLMPDATDSYEANSSFDAQLYYHPTSPANLLAVKDSQKATTKNWSLFSDVTGNPWRVVVVTVSTAAGLRKTVTTVLRPTIPANYVNPGSNQFFGGAVLGLDSIFLGNGARTMAFNSLAAPDTVISGSISSQIYNIGGDLNSKGTVTLASGSEVGGAVSVEGQAELSASNLGGQINQTLTYAQKQTGFEYNAPGDPDNSVINATANGSPDSNPIVQTSNVTEIPPALSPPVDVNGQSSATAKGQLAVTNVSSVSSDVTATSLSINSGASLSVGSGARIFIESGSNNFVPNGTSEPSSYNVMDIHGNANRQIDGKPGDPSKLQIWYNGTGTINIDGATLSATIYAPNANVAIKNSKLYGSIVARNIAGGYDASGKPNAPVTNTEFLFYSDIKTNPGLSYDSSDFTDISTWKVDSVSE